MFDRQRLRQLLGQITVGVDETKANIGFRILPRHVAEQCRLSSAGLPDDIKVHQPVFEADTKGKVTVAAIGLAKQGDVIGWKIHRAIVARHVAST